MKLAVLLALPLGWIGWDRLLLGLFTGLTLAAVGTMVLIAAGRARWSSELPLGPPLLLGTLLAVTI